MPQSFLEPQALPSNKPKKAWTFWLLLGVLSAGVAVAARIRLATLPEKSTHEQMKQGDIEEASEALETVLKKTSPDQRMALLLKSADDANYGLRYAAVDSLGSNRTPGSAEVLEHAFQDSSSVVRQRAMETLYTIDRERGRRLLLAGLRDEDRWVREAALNQFISSYSKPNTITDKKIVPMLVRTLDDSYEYMPLRAVSLLQKLTGNAWTYKTTTPMEQKQAVITKWKTWWQKNQSHWPAPPELRDVPSILPARADLCPEFSLHDLDGNPVTLSGQKGRITLLNFWGTWCAPCRAEVPYLQKLQETYSGKNVDIIGAAAQEPNGAKGVRHWCEKNGITYKQTLSTTDVEEKFSGVHEVPVSILLDAQGRIRYRWDGDRDYETFHAAVERLLHEESR